MSQIPEIALPSLEAALRDLQLHPSATLASPPGVPKRASVAVVLRVQPHPSHPPAAATETSPPQDIAGFFRQDWVAHGEVELLFIKRAARVGDRWTSHVAFPGGKRDPSDASDLAAAVRETWEEVGLDLSTAHDDGGGGGVVIPCGHLPDRVIKTNWMTLPLLVLCPFVFLHTSPAPPSLRLQPAEVASAHWVPLRSLLARRFMTVELCDVADRLVGRRAATAWMGRGLGALLGKMEFAAVRLWPSLSVYSSFGADFYADDGRGELLAWGITLGVAADLVAVFGGAEAALGLWGWPTFTALDVRLVTAAMTWRVRGRNVTALVAGTRSVAAKKKEGGDDDDDDDDDEGEEEGDDDARESGVLVEKEDRIDNITTLLAGYYPIIRTAAWVALAGRTAVVAAIGAAVWSRWRRR